MKRKPVLVKAADGQLRTADKAECDSCAGDTFLVLQIRGQRHVHYECALCGTSYCPGGECEKEERNVHQG